MPTINDAPIRSGAIIRSGSTYCQGCYPALQPCSMPLNFDRQCGRCEAPVSFYIDRHAMSKLCKDLERMLKNLGPQWIQITPYRIRVMLAQPLEWNKYLDTLAQEVVKQKFPGLQYIPTRLPRIPT